MKHLYRNLLRAIGLQEVNLASVGSRYVFNSRTECARTAFEMALNLGRLTAGGVNTRTPTGALKTIWEFLAVHGSDMSRYAPADVSDYQDEMQACIRRLRLWVEGKMKE